MMAAGAEFGAVEKKVGLIAPKLVAWRVMFGSGGHSRNGCPLFAFYC